MCLYIVYACWSICTWVSRKSRLFVATAIFRNLYTTAFNTPQIKNIEQTWLEYQQILPHGELKSQQSRLYAIPLNNLNKCIISFHLFLIKDSQCQDARQLLVTTSLMYRLHAMFPRTNKPFVIPTPPLVLCYYRITHNVIFPNPIIMRTDALVRTQRERPLVMLHRNLK
jgi:hypothetical protein